MSVIVYAYPWDVLGDPGAIERLRAIGADAVALATIYHAVRAATPQHPRHAFVEAPHAALYLDDDGWPGDAALRPASAAAWAGPDAAAEAAHVLADAGIAVRPWLVLTHDDPADDRLAHLALRDAYGSVMRHALCPSQAAVRARATAIVAHAAARIGADVVLEAAGPLGVEHLGAHEKTAGADWNADDRALLSVCCCPACGAAYARRGVDLDDVAARIRAGVGSGRDVATVLGDAADAVLTTRREAIDALLTDAVAAARAAGGTDVALHAAAGAWETGAGAAVLDAPLAVDVAVLPASAHPIATPVDARLGAYVSGMPGADERWDAWAEADELHVYHLGLLSAARWQRTAERVHAWRR